MAKTKKKKGKRAGYRAVAFVIMVLIAVGWASGAMAVSGAGPYPLYTDIANRYTLNDNGHTIWSAFFGNGISFEGAVEDAYETKIYFLEPTADRTITFPDASVTLQSGTMQTTALADGKIWIGNSGGTAVAVTPSSDWTITNAGVATIAASAVGSSEIIDNSVATGDILNSTITATDMAYVIYTVNVPAGVAFKNTTITNGYFPIADAIKFANITDADKDFVNSLSATGTTLTLITNGTSALERVYKVFTIAP